jgi:hypothetical protein
VLGIYRILDPMPKGRNENGPYHSPAPPQEHIMLEDHKALPGKLVGKGVSIGSIIFKVKGNPVSIGFFS